MRSSDVVLFAFIAAISPFQVLLALIPLRTSVESGFHMAFS